MIEKMKMVHIVTTVSHKDDMLLNLRDLGLVHLAERANASSQATQRFSELSKIASRLMEYAPDKKSPEAGNVDQAVLSDEAFQKMYTEVKDAFAKKESLAQDISSTKTEIERIQAWGDFDPQDVKALRESGIGLHFYRVGKRECQLIMQDDSIKAIRLASVDKSDTIAVIGKLPLDIPATEFQLPQKGLTELRQDVENYTKEAAHVEEVLKDAYKYENSFRDQMLKAQNAVDYSAADATVQGDEELVWISGYAPEVDLPAFKEAAAKNSWAYALEDVSEEDDQIPTKLRFNKVTKLISPLYDILGILPGYREADISLWFLLFFTLFFAMIMGDGGYGFLLLLATIAIIAKTKKLSTPTYLLLVLSIGTMAWGAITGTWFGMKSAMNVPLLRALTLPGFANYPESFGVTAAAQQSNIMKFSFTIGAMQMELGSLLSVKKKLGEKDLSFMADIGWMISIVAMYLLSLYLVIGQNVAIQPVFVAVGVGFVLVILFGGMGPGISFGQGLKAGLGNAFTVFLDTISCFGNVMSYIRLFAVGMAGLAIAQSFNSMASGLAHGPLMIAAIIVVVLGHALNIVMCILSVVVHGVRLNVLEFSGQVGLEWTGIPYEPFKKNDKIKS